MSKSDPLAEVKQFIASAPQPAADAAVKPAAELNLPPELQAFVQSQASGEANKLPEPSIPLEPVTQPEFPTIDTVRRDLLTNGQASDVTSLERDAYVKAVLFDQPIIWEIPMLGGQMAVTVRSIKLAHEDAVSWWMARLETTGKITNRHMWLTWFKRAATLLRVVSIRNCETNEEQVFDHAALDRVLDTPEMFVLHAERPEVTAVRTMLTMDDLDVEMRAKLVKKLESMEKEDLEQKRQNQARNAACDAIQRQVDELYSKLSPARYNTMMGAVAVHEQKLNRCNTEGASGNFWSPAGTV